MNEVYLLAVDLGTSFIKAAAYDAEGNCLEIKKEEVLSDASMPGIFVQRGEEIFQSVLACVRGVTEALGERSQRIAAIGFTGQMAGFIGVDESWRDITTWSCSLDTRYLPYADRQMEEMSQEFLEIGGTNSPLMAPKCQWFVNSFPERAVSVSKYMLISSYVIGRLGKCQISDASLADSYLTWTGLADIRSKTWSEELCHRSGISPDLLPKIVEASHVCGYLDREYALLLGLPDRLPLVAGAGDKIAGCVGSGILQEGDVIFETSSYGAVSCLQREYRPNRKRRDYDAIPACFGDMFYLHRYLPGSGITLKWFMDTFDTSFAEMEERIGKVPCGSEGLLSVGLLRGDAMPQDGSMRGAFIGHSWGHRKEHFYRALLEGYGYELAATLDSISACYPEWDRKKPIHVIGGGTGSRAWMQILADVTGSQILCHSNDDEALWGAALLAGIGSGVLGDVRAIKARPLQKITRIEPMEENHRKYVTYLRIYEQAKAHLKGTYQALQDIGKQE